MIIKGITDENFTDYKVPSLYIAFPSCSFKCDKECGKNVCQNSPLVKEENIKVNIDEIYDRYEANDITRAIVIGGLEPFDDVDQLLNFVSYFRYRTPDDIVIYTGYTEEELIKMTLKVLPGLPDQSVLHTFSVYENIIVKFGRFVPDQESHFDEVLGVDLASPNQYAKNISKENYR